MLDETEQVVPWDVPIDQIELYSPKTSSTGGCSAYPLAIMLRIHRMQQWYSLSEPALEKALIEMSAMWHFAGIDMVSVGIPYETTMMAFLHLLEKQDLGKRIFEVVKDHLKAKGRAMKQGTIIDATLIVGPRSLLSVELEPAQTAQPTSACDTRRLSLPRFWAALGG